MNMSVRMAKGIKVLTGRISFNFHNSYYITAECDQFASRMDISKISKLEGL